MKITRKHLKEIIREVYQSHTVEPQIGDMVVNVNPNCQHHESEGIVIQVEELPDEIGKSVAYECTNDGDAWDSGDVLKKTMDQLEPMDIQIRETVARVLTEDLTGFDKNDIKRMIKKEIESAQTKKVIDKAFKKNFDSSLKDALGVSYFGTPGKINKFVVDEIHNEVEKIMGNKATKEIVVQICKDVIIKLYRELSFSYKPMIDRLKI